VPPLVEALDGGDACVARLAVRLLGRARTPAALAALHRRLTAPAPAHRAQAAVGLGYAGQRSAVPRLVALLGDPAPTVREAAAWALGALH
jgi:HEAT repeat protein